MKTTSLPLELLEKLNPMLNEIVATATRHGGLTEIMFMASMKAVLEDLIAHRVALQKLLSDADNLPKSSTGEEVHAVLRKALTDLGYSYAD